MTASIQLVSSPFLDCQHHVVCCFKSAKTVIMLFDASGPLCANPNDVPLGSLWGPLRVPFRVRGCLRNSLWCCLGGSLQGIWLKSEPVKSPHCSHKSLDCTLVTGADPSQMP